VNTVITGTSESNNPQKGETSESKIPESSDPPKVTPKNCGL